MHAADRAGVLTRTQASAIGHRLVVHAQRNRPVNKVDEKQLPNSNS